MFLAVLFSSLCFLTGSVSAHSSVEVLRQRHLETVEGRAAFLTDELSPYVAAVNQLNDEVRTLSGTIDTLSPQEDQQQILTLTKEVSQKMGRLVAMLPVLNLALSVDEDLQQIEAILHQTEPLSPAQQEVVDRIASLCSFIH